MLTVRRASDGDAGALALVGSATFLETYALTLPGPDIVRHCAKAHATEVYAAWIGRADCAVWVLEAGSTIVGYAVLTPSALPGVLSGDLELQRIYLLCRFQGRGGGRLLVETVAAEAHRRGATRLTLGMYAQNEAARAFYTRMGFVQIGAREFRVGDKLCADDVLGCPLPFVSPP